MFVFNRDFRYVRIYIYIYVAVRQPICSCSVARNVGGVKCGPFLNHSNEMKPTLLVMCSYSTIMASELDQHNYKL